VRGWISRQRSLSICLMAAGFLVPTSGIAQNGLVRFLCEDSLSSARWSFSVDFDNQSIRAEVPINWTLITSTEVLFGHTAIAGGHYYLTQSYTLSRGRERSRCATTSETRRAVRRAVRNTYVGRRR
jgi:hypothetical protein